jgi:hypothetical protein
VSRKKAEPKIERIRIPVIVMNGRLTALDAFGQEKIDQLPAGRIFIELDTEEVEDGLRNKFFAGINTLYDNIDSGPGTEFPTSESLRREILREIGFTDPIFRVDGIKREPRSMARGAMKLDELMIVSELMRTYCVHRWGFDPVEMWEQEKDAEAANRARRR